MLRLLRQAKTTTLLELFLFNGIFSMSRNTTNKAACVPTDYPVPLGVATLPILSALTKYVDKTDVPLVQSLRHRPNKALHQSYDIVLPSLPLWLDNVKCR